MFVFGVLKSILSFHDQTFGVLADDSGLVLQVWCRLVTASFNYFHSTNFFWMFGEGCYLHTAIVLTYSTDKLRKWMFICIGWCECPHSYSIIQNGIVVD